MLIIELRGTGNVGLGGYGNVGYLRYSFFPKNEWCGRYLWPCQPVALLEHYALWLKGRV